MIANGADVKGGEWASPPSLPDFGKVPLLGGARRDKNLDRKDHVNKSIYTTATREHYKRNGVDRTLLDQVRQCVKDETEKYGRKPFVMDVVLDLKARWAENLCQTLLVYDDEEGDNLRHVGAVNHRTYDFKDQEGVDAYWADQEEIWRNFGTESAVGLEASSIHSEDADLAVDILGGRIGISRFPMSRERSTVTRSPGSADDVGAR
ncbi:hypothetical protein H1R20_g9197, partial [Candolleomyces eurysporus]